MTIAMASAVAAAVAEMAWVAAAVCCSSDSERLFVAVVAAFSAAALAPAVLWHQQQYKQRVQILRRSVASRVTQRFVDDSLRLSSMQATWRVQDWLAVSGLLGPRESETCACSKARLPVAPPFFVDMSMPRRRRHCYVCTNLRIYWSSK